MRILWEGPYIPRKDKDNSPKDMYIQDPEILTSAESRLRKFQMQNTIRQIQTKLSGYKITNQKNNKNN